MNIKELKAIIQDLPDTMDVFMDERLTEERYGLVNGATTREIPFFTGDEEEDENPPTETVLVLRED